MLYCQIYTRISYPRQIARQQRAFYLQSERIAAAGGRRFVSRHKAGEIALVHQPQTLAPRCRWEVWEKIWKPPRESLSLDMGSQLVCNTMQYAYVVLNNVLR